MKRKFITFLSLFLILISISLLIGCGPEPDPIDEPDGYKISYDLKGGAAENPSSYTEEDEFILHHPTKDGYTFIGWTYEGVTTPELFVHIKEGSSGELSFVANYKEKKAGPLKIVAFADVQLTTKSQDATANDYLGLRNNLQYAKSVNADVILLNGDTVNNAVEPYYRYFEQTLKEVYGTDESLYPEFVMNMGNHEWWDTNEKDTAEAVAMFKKYARIESEYLIDETEVTYHLDNETTLPTYLKVIEGVPFIVISGYNSRLVVNSELEADIRGWLEEVQELESVKKGGPIFVAYHNPIWDVTYGGEQTIDASKKVDQILKDYPNAICFTGDTHFNSVNERTIDQTNYTSINLGSSSYTRNMSKSATGNPYNNVDTSGRMKGDVNYKYQIHTSAMLVTLNDNETTIDRVFTADDVKDVKSVGTRWIIPMIKSKEDFTYTSDRIQNPEWAKKLYNKTGLDWANGKEVKFNIENTKIMINFDDVIDFNYAEYYRIKIQNQTTGKIKYYNYMSHYYKWEDDPHTYNIVINNNTFINETDSFAVTVFAFDYFDNQSTNSLASSAIDSNLKFPEEGEYNAINYYSNTTKILNYTDTVENSNSSVTYYYRGTYTFNSGLILERVIESSESMKSHLSATDWSDAELVFYAKNPNDFDIAVGFNLSTTTGVSTDGASKYQVTIPAGSDWVKVSYSLKDEFGINSNCVNKLILKGFVPSSEMNTKDGYEVYFMIDGIDIIDK